MIVVTAKFRVKSECKAQLLQLVEDVVNKTRTEDGCISYTLYTSTEDENELMFFEEWESRDALKAHAKSAHIQDYLAKKGDLLERDSAIKIYDVVTK